MSLISSYKTENGPMLLSKISLLFCFLIPLHTFAVRGIGYFIFSSDYLPQYKTLYKVKFRKSAKKSDYFVTKKSQDIY